MEFHNGEEYALASQLRQAKKVKHLSESQLAELEQMEGMREVVRKGNTDRLMVEIRALGCIPKDDHGVAQRFRKAMRHNLFSEEQLAELAEIGRANIQPLAEETEPPDPRDAFSEEASNRLEQDILLAKKFGVRFRKSKF